MTDIKVIVGLGNPGSEYEETRHNIGFSFLDYLLFTNFGNEKKLIGSFFHKGERSTSNWKEKFGALYINTEFNDEKIILLKPNTYMNLSGEPLRQYLSYFKYSVDEVLVCFDDIDLELGQLRLKDKGGSGGHNGIKSISEQFGTTEFKRLKLGVSRPKIVLDDDNGEAKEIRPSVSNWVLGKFKSEELVEIEDMFKRASSVCRILIKSGYKTALQRGKFKKSKPKKENKEEKSQD